MRSIKFIHWGIIWIWMWCLHIFNCLILPSNCYLYRTSKKAKKVHYGNNKIGSGRWGRLGHKILGISTKKKSEIFWILRPKNIFCTTLYYRYCNDDDAPFNFFPRYFRSSRTMQSCIIFSVCFILVLLVQRKLEFEYLLHKYVFYQNILGIPIIFSTFTNILSMDTFCAR